MQYLKEYGQKLVHNGYTVVPIKPGAKYPTLSGWQDAKRELVEQYIEHYPDAGVGILTKYTPAIDIDFMDREIVHEIEKRCIELLGIAPIRVGRAPKELLLFRTDEPFNKLSSRIYLDPITEDKCQLEILGDGQQFVAYAQHPDTHKPYVWLDKLQPLHVNASDLPLLTYENAKLLIKFVDELLCKSWPIYGANKTRDVLPGANTSFDAAQRTDLFLSGNDDPLTNTHKVDDATPEDFKEILDTVDADDYPIWFKVGMALYHQYDGDEIGFEIWDEWSQKSDKYNAGVMSKKWHTFKAENEKAPATARYILKLAGMQPPSKKASFDKMIENLIHVHKGDRIYDLSVAPHLALSKTQECRSAFKHLKTPVLVGKKEKLMSSFTLWENESTRKLARDVVYDPNCSRYYEEAGEWFVNEFFMPDHKPTTDESDIEIIINHFLYLLVDDVEREWFLDWLAFNVQFPGRRSKLTPLIIATAHGTGRGWIIELLKALLGKWNVQSTKMSVLSGEGNAGAYQDFLHKSLVCAIHEIRESANAKYTINDKVRDYLDAPSLELNLKYGAKGTFDIYTNFILMSNHTDALILPEEDRRINVLQGPAIANGVQYYEDLYGVLDNARAIEQYFWYLKRRDLTQFKRTARMDTKARSIMMELGTSDIEQAINQIFENPPHDVMSTRQVRDAILPLLEGDDLDISLKVVTAILAKRSQGKVRKVINGASKRGYIMVKKRQMSDAEIIKSMKGWDLDDLLE